MLCAKQCHIDQTGLPPDEDGTYNLSIEALDNVPNDTKVVVIKSGEHNLLILQLEFILKRIITGLLSKVRDEAVTDPCLNPYNREPITEHNLLTAAEARALKLPKENYQT